MSPVWMPAEVEVRDTVGALERLLPIAAGAGLGQPDLLVDLVVVRAALGAAAPAWPGVGPELESLAAIVRALAMPDATSAWPAAALDREPSAARGALLGLADGFMAPALAGPLADALEREGIAPGCDRLAALLARCDTTRCARLLERLRSTPGADSLWFASIVAARLAAHDDGRALTPELERAFIDAIEGDALSAAADDVIVARLRWASRHDPVGALAPLEEVVADRGAVDVADGVRAVLPRAARREAEAADRFIDRLEAASDRALALAALAADLPRGTEDRHRLVARAHALADGVREPRDPADAEPHTAWEVALALLEVAAARGSAALAERVVEAAGPPPCGAFLATWRALRRRGLLEGRPDHPFGLALDDALARRGPGRAAARAVACGPLARWEPDALAAWLSLKALPLPALPWWSAEEGGLP
jgi:hypothetical protein